MKLKEIRIKNFRSIKEATIVFDYNCKILIGKNEAGKSNVLKAIAAVFGQYKVSAKDKRKRIDNEKIKEYGISAIFNVEPEDHKLAIEILHKQYSNIELIEFENGTLEGFAKNNFKELLLTIDFVDGENIYCSCWRIAEDKKKLKNELYLSDNKILTEGDKKFDIVTAILNALKSLYDENAIKCHCWQYNNELLLPDSVDINSFKENPSSIKPLEHIFILCKRENIKKEFDDAKEQDGDYDNLLTQISEETTKTFRSIWKDFKSTSIELRKDGDCIKIKVIDKAKYSFGDRSDGFKKFISILLMLSSPSRSNLLGQNDIILIDEPDQSLYPTSARYLRDELLKIAKKSFMVYSTHSQYMIDSNCIDRHLIVEKKDDTSVLQKQSRDATFANDELLRNAIGTSIFEIIQNINIIFEGWLDKALFLKYCKFNKKSFDNVGMVHLDGISGVATLVQLLILANKKFIIVADADDTSKSHQNKLKCNYPEYKENWISYGSIDKDIHMMEDFINENHIQSAIKECGIEYEYNDNKNAIKNIEAATSRDKNRRQEIKKSIVETLKKENIKSSYSDYVKILEDKVNKLKCV